MPQNTIKKLIALILSALLLAAVGCANNTPGTTPGSATTPDDSQSVSGDAEKLSIVATIFPPYDFLREITGDLADVSMLLPPASESHSFEPKPSDIVEIGACDLFVYVGGESDGWVDTVLDSMDTSNMTIVTLMDCVDVVEEEIVEGMQDEEHDHGGGEDFDPSEVKDRPMSDFAGGWQSMVPIINDGSLDEYIEHEAEEAGVSFEEFKAATLQRVASEYDNIKIDGNTLSIGGNSEEYKYSGYEIVESDHGTSVWYKYETAAPDMPKQLMFNDHRIASGAEPEELPHIHMKYGNDGFAALVESGVSPFYFAAGFTHEEISEFMVGGHEHEEVEYDEHVWTSPRNAKLIVQKLTDALKSLDPANAEIYAARAGAYSAELDNLDSAFQEVVDNAARRTIIFGDRFPFRYFADAYGLDYFAAFPGCSTETECSAATIAFLIDKVRDENLPVIFHIELSNEKIAKTISEETGAEIRLLHAVHNISRDDFLADVGYLELMHQNVANLKEALS
ncbi:MAG: zinc ABC transporter substrate-binding protein [Oscillospiraceae bacterium]|jgi:zinc transport system substrate-binding protein|nr:zinc ABC transporter substrate-binding protein [Oscillospiraceae bacterium]